MDFQGIVHNADQHDTDLTMQYPSELAPQAQAAPMPLQGILKTQPVPHVHQHSRAESTSDVGSAKARIEAQVSPQQVSLDQAIAQIPELLRDATVGQREVL